MKIELTGNHHIKVTAGMKEAVVERLNFLEKHLGEEDVVKVSVSKTNDTVEVKLFTEVNGKGFAMKQEGDDFYTALDEMAGRLKENYHQAKEKNSTSTKRKRNNFGRRLGEQIEFEENRARRRIVKRKRVEDPVEMTEEDAIDTMIKLGHPTFIFYNKDMGGKSCMLYTREDGDFGIVEC